MYINTRETNKAKATR